LFRGALGYCTDEDIHFKRNCQGQFWSEEEGLTMERKWVVPYNNYDDIFHSMVTFFEVSTLEMWPDFMYAAVDSVGTYRGPKKNNRPLSAVVFIIFIFITTFFVMNLFISVIVDKFNEEIRKREG
jgi:hypothetical protein